MSDSFKIPPHAIRFRCTRCLRNLKASSEKSGQIMRCPACYFDLVVPYESTRKKVKESDLYGIDEKPLDNRDLLHRIAYASFPCPICISILSIFSENEIGTTIVCPECHNSNVVPKDVTRIVSQHEQQQIQQHNTLMSSLNGEQELVFKPSANSGDIYGVSDPNSQQYFAGTPENFNAIFDDGSFGVHCPLCNTLLNATEDMIGQKLVCPDCETEITVKKPQKIDNQPLRTTNFEGDTLYETQDEDGIPRSKEPLVPVVCSLCETRMYALASQIGQWKTCPDCETKTLIKDVPQEERILPQTAGSDYTVKEQQEFKRPSFRVGADYRKVEGSLDLDNQRYRREQEKKRLEQEKKRLEKENKTKNQNNENNENNESNQKNKGKGGTPVKKKGWFLF